MSAAPPSILQQANRLAAAGRPQDAIQLITRAAAKGDGTALFAMANWRLFGMNGPTNHPEARRYASAAARAGHVGGRHLEAALVANGVGGPADAAAARRLLGEIDDPVAARQRALLDAMPATGHEWPHKVLSEAPYIATIPALLTPAECDYLIEAAGPYLEPAHIVGDDGKKTPHPFRTSAMMGFGYLRSTAVVAALNRRFAAVTGTDVTAGEPLQVLRYHGGEEYRAHLDALPGLTNQRVWTVLTMLRPSAKGGETVFPSIGVTVRLGGGEALLFRNVTADGKPDRATLHAGLPVERGEKWLATRWIRQAPYTE